MTATLNAAANRLGAQAENARLLEKLRLTGVRVRSYEDWQAVGRQVRKGERMRRFAVQSGVIRTGIDPITGEDRYEPKMMTAWGFHESQTNAR